MGFFSSKSKTDALSSADAALPQGLSKTKESLQKRLQRIIAGKSRIDAETLDNLEETLIAADIGVDTTLAIVERVQRRAARDKFLNAAELQAIRRAQRLRRFSTIANSA